MSEKPYECDTCKAQDDDHPLAPEDWLTAAADYGWCARYGVKFTCWYCRMTYGLGQVFMDSISGKGMSPILHTNLMMNLTRPVNRDGKR